MSGLADDLSERNKHAWAHLYGSTPHLVWGRKPVGFLQPFLSATLPPSRRFQHALDAAAGEGRNLSALAPLAGRLVACDASAEALAKIPAPAAQRVRQVRCDLAVTPFTDGEFDFILLSDIVETLPEPHGVLREIRRILSSDGLLVCNIPGPEDEVAGIEMEQLGPNRYLYHGEFFYQFFAEADAKRLLNDAGFRILQQRLLQWEEEPHPEFRGSAHRHTSRVFLLERDIVA